jgi:hypothetical protein
LNIEAIREHAYNLLRDKPDPYHRGMGAAYSHGYTTGRIAVNLRKIVVPDDDSMDAILFAAGLFHDSCKEKEPHNKAGAEVAEKELKAFCTQEELETICRLIRMHNQRGKSKDVFEQILQDADALDHQGAKRLWIHFAVNAGSNKSMEHAIEYWKENIRGTFNDAWYMLDEARKIAKKRRAFFDKCMERFVREYHGNIT